MTLPTLIAYIKADYFRAYGSCTIRGYLKAFLFNPSVNYLFWLRVGYYLWRKKKANLTFLPLYAFALLKHRRKTYKLGIQIPLQTVIGPGFYIGHFGTIVVHPNAIIGADCSISPGVTIGKTSRGPRQGTPQFGNGVYIASGAKIIGSLTVGNNVAIGANCVVTHDIPDDAVVIGIPGRIISFRGSKEYIKNAHQAFGSNAE